MHGRADGGAHGIPDLLGIVLGEVGIHALHVDGMLGTADDVTGRRHDARTGTAGADIDGDE